MKTILRALSTALSMLILLSSVSVFSVAESGIENLKAQSSELIDSSVKFTDVNASSWYKNYVDYVATHELMNRNDAGYIRSQSEPDPCHVCADSGKL